MSREQLLEKKELEVSEVLEEWAKDQLELGPGEYLSVAIRIVRSDGGKVLPEAAWRDIFAALAEKAFWLDIAKQFYSNGNKATKVEEIRSGSYSRIQTLNTRLRDVGVPFRLVQLEPRTWGQRRVPYGERTYVFKEQH